MWEKGGLRRADGWGEAQKGPLGGGQGGSDAGGSELAAGSWQVSKRTTVPELKVHLPPVMQVPCHWFACQCCCAVRVPICLSLWRWAMGLGDAPRQEGAEAGGVGSGIHPFKRKE